MHSIRQALLFLGISASPLIAETVVVTSVADSQHPLSPITSLAGLPLAAGTQVRVGAFQGLSDDQILDLAAASGLSQITAAFTPFGNLCAIGQGVDDAAGGFEIAVQAPVTATPFAGQTVSLLIRAEANGEFLVARFPGKVFEEESATGLEPLLSLHLADAKILIGNFSGIAKLTTSPAPSVGSFSTWLAGFPAITDPAMKLPGADADSDGRSNFLEYATGGNPSNAGDPVSFEISRDAAGSLWVGYNRVPGLGGLRYSLEYSDDLTSPWLESTENAEADPEKPGSMKVPVRQALGPGKFFRLKVREVP